MKPEIRKARAAAVAANLAAQAAVGAGDLLAEDPSAWGVGDAAYWLCRAAQKACESAADALDPEVAETNANVFAAHLIAGRAAQEACDQRSEEHTSELQSPCNLVCRLLLEKLSQEKRNRQFDGIEWNRTKRLGQSQVAKALHGSLRAIVEHHLQEGKGLKQLFLDFSFVRFGQMTKERHPSCVASKQVDNQLRLAIFQSVQYNR